MNTISKLSDTFTNLWLLTGALSSAHVHDLDTTKILITQICEAQEASALLSSVGSAYVMFAIMSQDPSLSTSSQPTKTGSELDQSSTASTTVQPAEKDQTERKDTEPPNQVSEEGKEEKSAVEFLLRNSVAAFKSMCQGESRPHIRDGQF